MKTHDSNTPPHNPTKAQKALERFHSKLKPTANGCLEYIGGKLKTGYGIFNAGGSVLAHRFAYMTFHEVALKPNEYVRHLACNNPSCCNPLHLAVGSAKDNSLDMVNAGRSIKGRKNPQKRFTQEEKNQIRAYAAVGKSQYWIAKKYGRAESTISRVLNPRKPSPKPTAPAAAVKLKKAA
jgi:hypothetical protein